MADIERCSCCGKETNKRIKLEATRYSDFTKYETDSEIRTKWLETNFSKEIPFCDECEQHKQHFNVSLLLRVLTVFFILIILGVLIFNGNTFLETFVFYQNDKEAYKFSDSNARFIARLFFLSPIFILFFTKLFTSKGNRLRKYYKKEKDHPSPLGKYYLTKGGTLAEWSTLLKELAIKSKKIDRLFNIIIFGLYLLMAILIIISYFSNK